MSGGLSKQGVGDHGRPAWDAKDALAAAKARGQRLGGFRGYVPSETNRAQAVRARAAVARVASNPDGSGAAG